MPSKTPTARYAGPGTEESSAIEWRTVMKGTRNKEQGGKASIDTATPPSMALTCSFFPPPCSFLSGSSEPGDLRQADDLGEQLIAGSVLERVDGHRTPECKAARTGPAKRLQVRATTQFRANVVRVGADVKPLPARNPKTNFLQPNPLNLL